MKFILLFLVSQNVFASSFDWQGHRGARGLIPENTISAMKEALRFPVTTLELDVVISKDKKVVISHEPWMNPVICKHPEGKAIKEKEFNLYQMNYSEILRFDCGSLPNPRFPQQQKMSVGKPTFQAMVLELGPLVAKDKRQISYNIEIKSSTDQEKHKFQPGFTEFSDIVVGEVMGLLPIERFTIQSFDPRVLKYIRSKYPKIRLSYLVEKNLSVEQIRKNLGFLPEIISPQFESLSFDDVPKYHLQNMKIIPWTVNDLQKMRSLIGMGVDGIITDYPNLIEEVEKKECLKGFNLFEGECVKIPKNAQAWPKNPGWICRSGYIQKRSSCVKIKVPAHAVLKPDGKTWECKEKYKRYRGLCVKK